MLRDYGHAKHTSQRGSLECPMTCFGLIKRVNGLTPSTVLAYAQKSHSKVSNGVVNSTDYLPIKWYQGQTCYAFYGYKNNLDQLVKWNITATVAKPINRVNKIVSAGKRSGLAEKISVLREYFTYRTYGLIRICYTLDESTTVFFDLFLNRKNTFKRLRAFTDLQHVREPNSVEKRAQSACKLYKSHS